MPVPGEEIPLLGAVQIVVHGALALLAASIKAAACAGTSNAGVPPPKYSVSGRRVFFASSRSSAFT